MNNPIIPKLETQQKYPLFYAEATKTINDIIEHITKERGVYSSNIEPDPKEHSIWFNTNDNTLNIYKNNKWNVINGGTSENLDLSYISGVSGINMVNGSISGVNNISMSYGFMTGIHTINASGATLNLDGGKLNLSSGNLTGTIYASGANIYNATLHTATLQGVNITSGFIASGVGLNIYNLNLHSGTLSGVLKINTEKYGTINLGSGTMLKYADQIIMTYTGVTNKPIIMPNGGDIGNSTSIITICGISLTGGDFQKLANLT